MEIVVVPGLVTLILAYTLWRRFRETTPCPYCSHRLICSDDCPSLDLSREHHALKDWNCCGGHEGHAPGCIVLRSTFNWPPCY